MLKNIRNLFKGRKQQCNIPVKAEIRFINDVSDCFSLARYINGYYEYYDNTDDGDIYMNVATKKFMTEAEIIKEWVRLNNN